MRYIYLGLLYVGLLFTTIMGGAFIAQMVGIDIGQTPQILLVFAVIAIALAYFIGNRLFPDPNKKKKDSNTIK